MLESEAESLKQLVGLKESIEVYEKLFAKSKNQLHGYELVALQFQIKRFAEAQATIESVLKCELLENATIQFPKEQIQTQNVLLKATIYNLKGLIEYKLKDKAANKSFEEALSIIPIFAYALQNSNALKLEMKNK